MKNRHWDSWKLRDPSML